MTKKERLAAACFVFIAALVVLFVLLWSPPGSAAQNPIGMLGFDATRWRPVSVDTTGKLNVNVSSAGVSQVEGRAANGAPPVGNPVWVCGFDGTNCRTFLLDSSGRLRIIGAAADGAAVAGDPLRIAGKDGGGLTQDMLVDTSGNLQVVGPAAEGAAIAGGPIRTGGTDGANIRTVEVVSTTTKENSTATVNGAVIVESGGRGHNIGAPAAGSQATTTLVAGGAGVRNVIDCISFSASATTAPALTAVQVVIRDGATGVGPIRWQYNLAVPAATGQVVPPHSECGLQIIGSDNTAMTVEWTAGIANVLEVVNFTGFRISN